MKLPGFFKGQKHKSEGASDSDAELEYPGNAAGEFVRPSDVSDADSSAVHPMETPLPAEVIHQAETISKPSESQKEAEVTAKEPTPPAPTPPAPAPGPAAKVPAPPTKSPVPNATVQREPDSIESLWFSLIDNPNNEKNLNLLIRFCETRKGPAAVEAAISELAMEEEAYLPQLIMASRALERKASEEAFRHYDALFSRGIPNDYTLLRMSADLGRHGHPEAVIRLASPYYNPAKNNEYIGLNLLQAYKDSGRIDEGRAVWAQLKSMNRPRIAAALDTLGTVFGPKISQPDSSNSDGSRTDLISAPTDSDGTPADLDVRFHSKATALQEKPLPEVGRTGERPRIIEIPSWKLWIPALRDILPEPEQSIRVGLYLYSDTSSTPSDVSGISPRAVAVGLPILIGEMLLFSAPVVPVVLFPLSFSKGPDSGVAEPDVEGLFALCARESLNYLIAGTVSFDGNRRTIRTWILDRAKNTARVLSQSGSAEDFGGETVAHIDEIIEPFLDKNYAFEVKRRGFAYSVPGAPLIETHLDALTRLGLRALVDSGHCSSDMLCPQPEFLEKLAELCRLKPFSQNYLMMLLGGMISDRENGGETFLLYRELLSDTAHKLQYTPCVTTARKALDKVLTL